MDYKIATFEDQQIKRYVSNSARDSDVEYEDETDSDAYSSDTDDDIDAKFSHSSITSVDLQNKSYSKYYNNLTTKQKQAYLQICDLFTKNKGAVVTINSRSGTGKTYLLTAITKTFAKSVQFITFRRDQASEIAMKLEGSATVYTYISFYLRCFNLNYVRAIQLFTTSMSDEIDLLYKLILYSKKYLNTGTNIIVVDSCTLPSATMILLLYIISLKHGIHLIFSGNKIQLSAMFKPSLHSRSNFDIINLFNDMTIRKLTHKRSFDKTLNNKLSQFRKMIQQNRPKNEVPFRFNLRYYLYCCFRSKYFTEERFDVLYMSQFHKDITERLHRFVDYLDASKTNYLIVPYYTDKMEKIPTPKKQRDKFFSGLILAEGYKYYHVNRNGVHSVVVLEKITSMSENSVSLSIRFLLNNSRIKINVGELNYYQVLPALRAWLFGKYEKKLYQFPLRPYTLTYHAALGRTISNEKVELSADCSLANTIYVGLCCIRKYDDIQKIHATRDLPSFVVMDYMRKERNDDKYYYRCPSKLSEDDKNKIMQYVHEKGPNNFIDSIKWRTVQSLTDFERTELEYFARIPCSVYETPRKTSEKTGETRLMTIASFVKDNPHVVLDTMAKAPANDVDKFNKTVKNPGYRNSDTYARLKEEYTKWNKCAREE
ncbi:uncharacterized protein LOC105664234 [Megachile rotundata]|uniref:uncharacterized protein LOC105664234 n=1 Tax=Megachile rotundata TaxID=143995 RepID=UPI003FD68EB4